MSKNNLRKFAQRFDPINEVTSKSAIIILLFIIPLFFTVNYSYAQETASESKVPEWVKTTAGWYSQGLVSEGEFLNAIKYLVENKIIVLDSGVSEPVAQTEDSKPVDAFVPISKPRLNYCLILYPTYQNLGAVVFQDKYSHVNYIKDCVKLYRDPIWGYTGADRVDKLYEKFLQFREQTSLEKPKQSTEPSVRVLSSVNVGTEKYMVKFNVCAGDLAIDKAKILIKSEIDSIEIGSSKDIPANSCRTYETQLLAKYVANIKASIVEQFYVNEN